jgi:Outer membrane protein beta-barrel domain
MYKKFLLFFIPFLAFLMIEKTHAQYAYWGIKGGVQANKIASLSFDTPMSPGFNVGIFGNFILSEKFAIQHELLYSQRGFGGTTLDSFEVSGRLPYIDLPWMIHYNLNRVFHVHVGVQPSLYMFFKKAKADSSEFSKYNVNPIDFSGLLGVGAIMNNNILFGIRVNVSLGQTFNTEEFGGRNIALQAYIGYAVNRKVKKKKKK